MTSKAYADMADETNKIFLSHFNLLSYYVKNPHVPICLFAKLSNLDVNEMTRKTQTKIFKDAVKAECDEVEFWKETTEKLNNMSFLKLTAETSKFIRKNR